MKKALVLTAVAATLFASATPASAKTTFSKKGVTTAEKKKGGLYLVTTDKKLRGTWYAYNKKTKKYSKLKFTTHQLNSRRLLAKNAAKKYWPAYPVYTQWLFAKFHARAYTVKKRDLTWLNVNGWYEQASAGNFYAASTIAIKKHKLKLLLAAAGKNIWVKKTYAKTKKAAKKVANYKLTTQVYY